MGFLFSWERSLLAFFLMGVVAASQASNAPAPAVAPQSPKVAAGEAEAKKPLLLMDTDKNGKVSRAEFMSFMAAEFDRLDVNHDGELDVDGYLLDYSYHKM